MKRPPNIEHDCGASALIVALSMLLIMGFAALVVDLGAGFNDRSRDQSTADASVLGGAVESFLSGDAQAVVDEASTLVDSNVGHAVTDPDWVACQDPDQLNLTAGVLGLSPGTDCISWTGNYTEMRVRIPDQSIPTTFGRVLGASGLITSAAAQATVGGQGTSNSPPLVVTANTSAGQEVCLRTSPSSIPLPPLTVGNGPGVPYGPSSPPEPDPCDDSVYDPASEFFGTLLPYVYADPTTGDVICDTGEVEYSLAVGIDHTLSSFDPDFQVGISDPTGPDVKEEGVGCTGNPKIPQPYPNTMKLNTGLSAQELRCGLLTTKSGVCGTDVPGPSGTHVTARLQSGAFMSTAVQFLQEDMDNKPLWDFFRTNLDSLTVPQSCKDLQDNLGNAQWDYYDKKDALVDCLSTWDSTTDDTLFANDTAGQGTAGILDEPRFFFLPYLAEGNLVTDPSTCISSSSTQCVHFNAFVPVYLQATYSGFSGGSSRFDCDPGGNKRWGIHQAGEPGNCGRDNDNLDRISGIVLACGMFPDTICLPDGSGPAGTPAGTPVLSVYLSR
jgi:hypothetical protein